MNDSNSCAPLASKTGNVDYSASTEKDKSTVVLSALLLEPDANHLVE
jgi:hypothetical protein